MSDERQYREALSYFATGVTVVSTFNSSDEVVALTVSSFTSLSLQPHLILICVSESSDFIPALRHSGRFSVDILPASGHSIATGCAYLPSTERRKFFTKTISEKMLFPVSHKYLAGFRCKLHKEYPGGDHIIIVGMVTDFHINKQDDHPLLYYKSQISGNEHNTPVTG